MAFELVRKHANVSPNAPMLRIRTGNIAITRVAHALLGSPSHVLLYYDADTGRLALAPAEATVPNAYFVSHANRIPTISPALLLRRLAPQGFVTNDWQPASMEDGMLVCGPVVGKPQPRPEKVRDIIRAATA